MIASIADFNLLLIGERTTPLIMYKKYATKLDNWIKMMKRT
jgi:hypothetical protein